MNNSPDDNPYRPPTVDVSVTVRDEQEHVLASRGSRLAASIVDGLLLAVIYFGVLFVSGYSELVFGDRPPSITALAMMTLGSISLYLLLHGYLLKSSGQTVGKKLLDIQIVDQETGHILPFGRLVGLRLLPLWVVGAIPIIAQIGLLIDCLFIFRADRRCVHDHIAGTKVVGIED